MGVGNWYGRRKRRAELSIYLPFRSVFWRIVFDWLPSDTKRALNREMHQDFSVNARVPPKSASERLENTSSAASWRSPYQFPTPIFSRFKLLPQSWFSQRGGTPGLWLAVLYWMQRSMLRLFMRKKDERLTLFLFTEWKTNYGFKISCYT